MNDFPNTAAPAKEAIALEVQSHIDGDQRWSLELGGVVTLTAKRMPIQVIDFYPKANPK